MTSPEIEVNPGVLRWARETSGFAIAEAAEKADTPPSELERWELKVSKIRFSVLKKLACAYKRPTVALLLDAPPEEPQNPAYFRLTKSEEPLGRENWENNQRLACSSYNTMASPLFAL